MANHVRLKLVRARSVALLLSALAPSIAGASCLELGKPADVANVVNQRIQELEAARTVRRARPTVWVVVGNIVDTDTTEMTGATAAEIALMAMNCVSRPAIGRSVAVAAQQAQLPLAFVSPETDPLVRAAQERIATIGQGGMDDATKSMFHARDINYVVVLGGRVKAKRYQCTHYFNLRATVDVHSVETREILSSDIETLMAPVVPGTYLKFEAVGRYPQELLITSTSPNPVCLGDVNFSARDILNERYEWTERVGCIMPEQPKRILPPRSSMHGHWNVKPTNKCITGYGFQFYLTLDK